MYLKLVNDLNENIGINEVGGGLFELIFGADEDCNSIVLDKENLTDLIHVLELYLKRDCNK